MRIVHPVDKQLLHACSALQLFAGELHAFEVAEYGDGDFVGVEEVVGQAESLELALNTVP